MPAIAPALLEYWLREYYFDAQYDLSSSGVEDFSVAELKQLIGLDLNSFNDLVFHDSPALGSEPLRHAIAKHYNGSAQNVMVGNGSSEVIFLLMNALLKAGDEIVVVEPCYPALRQIAASIGCEVKDWNLHFEDQFEPDLNRLASLLTDKTKMVVINFPHNPTGASLSHQQQQELVDLVSKTDAYLVWDAVFVDINHAEPLQDFHQLYEKTISIGTLSKAYGLPGIRVGWAFAPDEVLKQCVHWRDYITICLSPLIDGIATHVMQHAKTLIDLRQQQAETNLSIVSAWMNAHQDYVQWIPSKGGVSSFPRFTQVDDIETFCRDLMEQENVLLAPGTCFGHQQHVRLGFGAATETLQGGLDRLSQFLQR
ncbi:capreomycidine synthase [Candidatus Albibeggiatoa sp. nov. NOAA]|uniref:capreomycidine synthase n=1 Tax=Candidatus Albibeggiatoa sp. nov. NOAA TaxID=3162724 RepID=UPI0032F3C526|nr:capreomycidine synthase [Thiotrichaceae bacterium]